MNKKQTIISESNTKLGKIRSVSLPHQSCRPDAPCFTLCYNNKAYRMYKEVRTAYQHNYTLFTTDPLCYFNSIKEQLSKKRKGNHFRYHVSGDIPSPLYLSLMITLAEALPNWNFLAFTKQYPMINNYLTYSSFPQNLKIIFSAWEHFPLPNPHNLPIAYHYLPSDPDPRIPSDAFPCTKKCDTCFKCWNLTPNQSIVLQDHS